MNSFTIIICAAFALAAGDVSHLNSKYLPPHHHHHHHHHGEATNLNEHYETAPSNFITSFQLENGGLSAPEGASSFTSNHYSVPEANINSHNTFSFDSSSSQSAPETAASFSVYKSTEYKAPISNSLQTFGSYSGPKNTAEFSSFDAGEGASSFLAPQTASLTFGTGQSAPSFNSFNSESSFSAPNGAASEINTHYAANGGYVY